MNALEMLGGGGPNGFQNQNDQRRMMMQRGQQMMQSGAAGQPSDMWSGMGNAAQMMAGAYLANQARQQLAPQAWQQGAGMGQATGAPLDLAGAGQEPPYKRFGGFLSGLFGLGQGGGMPTGEIM